MELSNGFSVLFGRFLKKLWKICFVCTYDQMKILQRFCIKLRFTKSSPVFFPLFWKVLTNKIYEFPEIHNKIPKAQPNTCLNNSNLPGKCNAKSVLFCFIRYCPSFLQLSLEIIFQWDYSNLKLHRKRKLEHLQI